jgi:hypothetical protein
LVQITIIELLLLEGAEELLIMVMVELEVEHLASQVHLSPAPLLLEVLLAMLQQLLIRVANAEEAAVAGMVAIVMMLLVNHREVEVLDI